MAGCSPWDQQPSESSLAYAAFCAYRDLGSDRSIAKTAHQLGRGDNRQLERWSSKHSWLSRVTAWDADLQRQWNRERIALDLEFRRAGARRAQRLDEKLDKAIEGLKPRSVLDVSRLSAVKLAEQQAALAASAGARPLGQGRSTEVEYFEDLEQLTDEEIDLRLIELVEQVERDLREHAEALGVEREDLEEHLHGMASTPAGGSDWNEE